MGWGATFHSAAPPVFPPAPIYFAYAGTPSTSTFSEPVRVDAAASSIRLYGLLGTAGAGNTTVGIYRNGVLVASVILGAGVTNNVSITAVALVAGDLLTAHVTTVGPGAADLTAQVYLT